MRQNKSDRASIDGVKVTYEVRGLNLDRLINFAKKKGFTLYDVKKYGNKRLIVSVSLKESKNFFAITKELCYNIKKVRENGVYYPLLKLSRSLGVVIGAIIITLTAIYLDGVILSVSYFGSGSIYHREVEEYLKSRGVTKYALFSDFSLSALEDEILSANERLSFVSCKKVGSRLQVELALSKEPVQKLNSNIYSLCSDCVGVVEDIKIYRGTALVQKGQTVEKGQVLVDGYTEIKDQKVPTFILASVVLSCEKITEYHSNSDDDKENALIFAAEELGDATIIDQLVFKRKVGEEYAYTVVTKYKKIISAG